jgi:hypothetical protein
VDEKSSDSCPNEKRELRFQYAFPVVRTAHFMVFQQQAPSISLLWGRRAGVFSMSMRPRRGNITVFAAVLSVVILGMVAFAVDCGFITLIRTDLQAAADAGALAGAGDMPLGDKVGTATARKFVVQNSSKSDGNTVDGRDRRMGLGPPHLFRRG